MFVNVVAKEKKLCEKRSQLAGGSVYRGNAAQFHDDLVSVVEVFELLRIVTNLNFGAPSQVARQSRNFSEDCFQESRLARSVWSDHSETFAAAENQRNVPRQYFVSIPNRRFIHSQHMSSRALDFLQTKISGGLFGANRFDAVQAL